MTSGFLEIAKRVNNFYFNGFIQKKFLPLLCNSDQVGMILPEVASALEKFPNVFTVKKETISMSPNLSTLSERSDALEYVLKDLHSKGDFSALNGWRDECYDVKMKFSDPPLFQIERAAAPLLGVKQYNVHINGIYGNNSEEPYLCLQRRSASKQTWPGMLDSFVSGGISAGSNLLESAKIELKEEANVCEDLSKMMKSAGAVSFLHVNEHGIYPLTDFVFDLELPEYFEPFNNDGEVSEWKKLSLKEVVEALIQTEMGPGTQMTFLDFLIRKGVITLKNEPDLPELLELLHIPLHRIFQL